MFEVVLKDLNVDFIFKLFGTYESNVRLIENALSVKLLNRGDGLKITGENVLNVENAKIVDCKAVYRAILLARLLVGEAERVFVGDYEKGEIIVPEIVVKAVFCRDFKKSAHLSVNSRAERLGCVGAALKILEYFTEL